MTILPGRRLSYQSHERRAEHWTVVQGVAEVLLDGATHTVETGESIDVPVHAKHRCANPGDVDLVFVEVQTGDYFGEDDIVRYEDDYGRVELAVRIDELLARGRTTSFEFFPPKTDAEERALDAAIARLSELTPSFVSVTYRGGAASRTPTFRLVRRLHEDGHIESMAHLTCVHHTRDELTEILTDYREAGIENLMLLGGDPDPGAGAIGDLVHATELVALARAVGEFCIGVAAHPAGHPDSLDLATDRRFLAAKLEQADFAVTQFFFEADEWRHLVADVAALGITKPIVPGIMPVLSLASLTRMQAMGGSVPGWLVERLDRAGEDGPAAVRTAGISAATELCQELLASGAPGLHFYTLNRSSATREIVAELRT